MSLAKDVCFKTCNSCKRTESPSVDITTPPSLPPIPSDVPSHSPTKEPIVGGEACCSQDFKNCADLDDWCIENEENCNSCGGIIIYNAPLDCIFRWGDCTDDMDGCCSPATCQGDSNYAQCLGDP